MSIISKLKASIGNNIPEYVKVFGMKGAIQQFGDEEVSNALGINKVVELAAANGKGEPTVPSVAADNKLSVVGLPVCDINGLTDIKYGNCSIYDNQLHAIGFGQVIVPVTNVNSTVSVNNANFTVTPDSVPTLVLASNFSSNSTLLDFDTVNLISSFDLVANGLYDSKQTMVVPTSDADESVKTISYDFINGEQTFINTVKLFDSIHNLTFGNNNDTSGNAGDSSMGLVPFGFGQFAAPVTHVNSTVPVTAANSTNVSNVYLVSDHVVASNVSNNSSVLRSDTVNSAFDLLANADYNFSQVMPVSGLPVCDINDLTDIKYENCSIDDNQLHTTEQSTFVCDVSGVNCYNFDY